MFLCFLFPLHPSPEKDTRIIRRVQVPKPCLIHHPNFFWFVVLLLMAPDPHNPHPHPSIIHTGTGAYNSKYPFMIGDPIFPTLPDYGAISLSPHDAFVHVHSCFGSVHLYFTRLHNTVDGTSVSKSFVIGLKNWLMNRHFLTPT